MKKGFTLIELLVVIAILAILAVAVVLVINPAQLLKESRDVTRISDLNTLNNAISLYLADNSNSSWAASSTICTSGTAQPSETTSNTCTANAIYTTTGTGWVSGVIFTSTTLGSPLGALPRDPNTGGTCGAASNSTPTTCMYVFQTNGTYGVYKLMANMESTKYTTSGTGDVETNTKDGGNLNGWYELGTRISLPL